ncbi:hypothetical protein BDK51DRAFT_30150 [Blyttiomyces helicus]|uniref:Uncharacterized protein n=1 Tax=Blyttiomyces helicus TaxID=388810 RepID=A0A4P9W7W8_9FUNG|nr:hypothetical protein BDK51DRAFT_30150 [Blyttiomyces helicus]|eukprot:RKO87148.1 hypothetical protein BDK51DRAFT_30150 [Blyttiomyces helicus]
MANPPAPSPSPSLSPSSSSSKPSRAPRRPKTAQPKPSGSATASSQPHPASTTTQPAQIPTSSAARHPKPKQKSQAVHGLKDDRARATPLLPAIRPPPADLAPERTIVMGGADELDGGGTGRSEIDVWVEWVTASLRELEEVTVLGVDPALPNMVSTILILRTSGVAVLQSLDSTTMESIDRSPHSCLRAVLRRGAVGGSGRGS